MLYTLSSGVKMPCSPSDYKGMFWLTQNRKQQSEWGQLANNGHKVEHLILGSMKGPATAFGGRVRIDDKEYTYRNARYAFFLCKFNN